MLTEKTEHLVYTPDWEQRLPVVPQVQVTLNCNLACDYCFQEHSGGIIELSTVEKILDAVIAHNLAVAPQEKTIQIYWHGGEPLLAGVDFFRQVLRLQAAYPELTFVNRMQTNGVLMNEELARLLVEHEFQVGFSLDGPKDIHDRHRRFRGTRSGSFDATMSGIECYRRQTDAGRVAVIAVVTRTGVHRARDIFEFFRKLQAEVQLDIYDLRLRDLLPGQAPRPGPPELAPSPEDVAKFLIELFDLWFYDPEPQVDFRELRQEVKMLLQPEIDRGDPLHKKRCDFRRLIFAPDGSAYSCDQWVNDAKTALGNIHRDPLTTILERKALLWSDIKKRIRRSGSTMACGECEWGRQCGGGCLTCMKYNALLVAARSAGLPDSRWSDATLPPPLSEIKGETYYCDALRSLRRHAQQAIQRELSHARSST